MAEIAEIELEEEDVFEAVSQEDDERENEPHLIPEGNYQLGVNADPEKATRRVRTKAGLKNVLDVYVVNPPYELDEKGKEIKFQKRITEWLDLKSSSNFNGRQRVIKLAKAFQLDLPTGALARADYETLLKEMAGKTVDARLRILPGSNGYGDSQRIEV